MSHHLISSLSDWDHLAQELLSTIKPGTIIALSGPLGAGKTTFVQALAKALQIKDVLVSPTFSLVRTYSIKNHPSIKKLIHVDAYRIDDEKDVMTIGLDELLEEKGSIMCLEWPEQIESWLKNQSSVIRLTITSDSAGQRTVHIKNAST